MDTLVKPVGVYDDTIQLFENQYLTPQGITYNSYLVVDEKIALVDTTDHRTVEQWRHNLIDAIPDGRGVDFLIIEHLEPDHSSQIEWVMDKWADCRLVMTVAAAKMLPEIVDTSSFGDRVTTVKDGDTLCIGSSALTFFTAPMVHWPEVMVVWEPQTGTLFAADAFGRFGDGCASTKWADEARRYYTNIVGKYGSQVQALLRKVAHLPVKTIAPLHGPMITGKEVGECIALYDKWSSYQPESSGVLIACASIHGMTLEAARELQSMLAERGVCEVKLTDLTHTDLSNAVAEAFRLGNLVLMSSTYDAGIFTPMLDFLSRLKSKGLSNRRVGLVENGLWAPAAARQMRQMLESMHGMEIVEPMVTIRGRLTSDSRTHLTSLAAALAEAVADK